MGDLPWLAVVGAGRWGKNHITTAASLGGLGLVVDSDESRLDEVKKVLVDVDNVVFGTNLRKALSEYDLKHVTACVVAVPPTSHFEVAMDCLHAGLDVLVEKPLTLDPAHARILVETARQKSLILMVGHILRYDATFEEMLSMIQDGRIGSLKYISASRKNFGTVRSEENVLWSLAPHDVSMVLAVQKAALPRGATIPQPRVQSCDGSAMISPTVHDMVHMRIELKDGVSADIDVSWLHPFKERRLIAAGEKGFLVFDDAAASAKEKLTFYDKWYEPGGSDGGPPLKVLGCEEEQPIPVIQSDVSLLAREQLHFSECCQRRKAPLTDGLEGLMVAKILYDAQEKLDSRPTTPGPMETQKSFVHASAVVDDGAVIGDGTKVWHFSHVCAGAKLGERCNVGQNVYIAPTAILGCNVKVQNNVSIYDGVVCEDDVFLGPSCVFTNIKNPRSAIVRRQMYTGTILERGATVGANATIICGLRLGRNSFVGAGSVVTKNVEPFTMVCGNPARFHAYVSAEGNTLQETPDGSFECKTTRKRYILQNGQILEKG